MCSYPVSLCVNNKLCVVVGSGSVAQRKIKSLLGAGARVKVISSKAINVPGVVVINRDYKKGDLKEAALVIAATDNRETNKEIYDEAIENNLLVNVVDDPKLCNFFIPSVVKRGKFQIAISTGGAYPLLSKKIRKELEEAFNKEYEKYVELLEEARKKVLKKYPPSERKAKLNEILNDKNIEKMIKQKSIKEARERLGNWI